jgi:hypothetical protein
MKAQKLIAAVSLFLAAGAALADGKTREQVVAEVYAARAAGLLDVTEADFPPLPQTPSTLSRAQVRAETLQAIADGEVGQTEADFPRIVSQPSGMSREQVKAEVLAARAAGLLDQNEVNYPRDYGNSRRPNVDARLQARAAALPNQQ